MKDEKLYVKRDMNEEGTKEVPDAVKGGLRELDTNARTDANRIDKEDKKLKLKK